MTILAVVFWVSVALLVYTHVGYPALLWASLGRAAMGQPPPATSRSHASRSSSPPTTRRT